MQTPTVHLNGSHPRTLLADYCAAADALREAMRRMGEAFPNGRDYQTPADLAIAQVEHQQRLADVRRVLRDIETLAEHVSNYVR